LDRHARAHRDAGWHVAGGQPGRQRLSHRCAHSRGHAWAGSDMRQPITVLLVDDHAVVRAGYRRLLEDSGRIVVIGEAATAAAAYQQFCQLAPRVVVMDIALPGASGIEAMRRILAREPGARILAFSMYEEAIFVRRAFEAGAAGYL